MNTFIYFCTYKNLITALINIVSKESNQLNYSNLPHVLDRECFNLG